MPCFALSDDIFFLKKCKKCYPRTKHEDPPGLGMYDDAVLPVRTQVQPTENKLLSAAASNEDLNTKS